MNHQPTAEITAIHSLGEPAARREATWALVALLLGSPQRDLDAPTAYPAGPSAEDDLGVRPEPVSYKLAAELYSSSAPMNCDGDGSPSQAAARVNNRRKASGGRRRGRSSPSVKRRASKRPRPGTGGRQPRPQPATTVATQRLHAILGQPDEVHRGERNSKTEVWRISDPSILGRFLASQGANGDADSAQSAPGPRGLGAFVAARLSSRELQGGETIGGQILDGIRLARAEGLEVKAILASTNHHSELLRADRWDFNYMLEEIQAGTARAVIFRETDRIARKQEVAHQFVGELARAGGDLYLAELSRRVDWDADGDLLQFSLTSALAEAEARKAARRMHTALRRRWIEQGRGWPGAKRFGFRRNAETKYLEVDPKQWWIVQYIHENYLEAQRARKNGCAVLHEQLAEMGIGLSAEKIRKILLDPIYVDGNYASRFQGHLIANEPIPLPNPIPRSLYQRNLEALATRKGPNTVTPAGTFCLNGIKIFDAAVGFGTGVKPHPIYKGRLKASRPAYYFIGPVPEDMKRPRPIPRDVLEPAVIEALLRLADDPELQRVWTRAARVESESGQPAMSAADVRDLEQRLAALRRSHEAQLDELTDRAEDGQEVTATHRAVAEKLEKRIDQLKAQLDAARASAKRQRPGHVPVGGSGQELRRALGEILTVDVPEDAALRVRRQAVIDCCLERIVIERRGEEGDELSIELFGPLVPLQAVQAGVQLPVDPTLAARNILEAHLQEAEDTAGEDGEGGPKERDGQGGAAALSGNRGALGNTSIQGSAYVEVFRLVQHRQSDAGREEHRRSLRRQNRWPEKLRHFSGPPTPAWTTTLSLAIPLPTELGAADAIRRAAELMTEGQPLTWNAYQELSARHPELPHPGRLLRTARKLGLSFAEWRNELAPEHAFPARRRDGYWTIERIKIAFRRLRSQAPSEQLLSRSFWDSACASRPDLPSRKRIEAVAKEHGTTFARIRDEALAE